MEGNDPDDAPEPSAAPSGDAAYAAAPDGGTPDDEPPDSAIATAAAAAAELAADAGAPPVVHGLALAISRRLPAASNQRRRS